MKKIPSYLISQKNFNNGAMVPNLELIAKRWTPGMIKLLGPPAITNPSTGVLFWPKEAIYAIMETPEFRDELYKLISGKITGPIRIIDTGMLQEVCELLYDLNKLIKTKMFSARNVTKIYDFKTYLIEGLLANGYVREVVYEHDTNLFRFTVEVGCHTYVWHQPYEKGSKLVSTCAIVESDKNVGDERPINPTIADAIAASMLFLRLEQLMLSIILQTENF